MQACMSAPSHFSAPIFLPDGSGGGLGAVHGGDWEDFVMNFIANFAEIN